MVWFQDDWSGSAHSFTWKIRVWWNAEIKSFLVLKFCASQSRHLLTITLAMQCRFFSNCRAIILGNQHYVCRVCISPDPFHVNNMRHILIQFSASWWSLDDFIYLMSANSRHEMFSGFISTKHEFSAMIFTVMWNICFMFNFSCLDVFSYPNIVIYFHKMYCAILRLFTWVTMVCFYSKMQYFTDHTSAPGDISASE